MTYISIHSTRMRGDEGVPFLEAGTTISNFYTLPPYEGRLLVGISDKIEAFLYVPPRMRGDDSA